MLDISKATTPKTIEEIKQTAPSIFTAKAMNGVSKHYTHIPTHQIIEDMGKLGWQVVDAKEVKTRKEQFKGFQKHLIVFRNTDVVINGEDGDTVFPQILLTNSHDGKSSFTFRVGLFRLVCENGLVVATKEFENLRISHMGYKFEELQILINGVLEKLPLTIDTMNLLTKTKLSQNKAEDFAQRAAGIRFGKEIKFDISDLLKPTRPQDEGNDLWSVFNVVQEKLVQGGFHYNNGRKSRKARKVKNFHQDLKINQELYELALEYAE
jgi:hypothetical protein